MANVHEELNFRIQVANVISRKGAILASTIQQKFNSISERLRNDPGNIELILQKGEVEFQADTLIKIMEHFENVFPAEILAPQGEESPAL